MIDVDALLAERPSPFELALSSRLGGWSARYPVDFLPPDPGHTYVVDAELHGQVATDVTRSAADTASLPSDDASPPSDETSPLAEDTVPAEVASFARLLETGAAHLGAARNAYREQCRQSSVQARELAAFAAARPAGVLDRPDGEVGSAAAASRAARPAVLTAVSEWAVDEVMAALGLSSAAAGALLAESVTLVEQLPGTLAALEAGTIGWTHARMLVEVLAPLADPDTRAAVEARLLAGAAGRTVPQLRASARRAVLRADATAATRRLARAIQDRRVRVFPGEDGMATLTAGLPTPVALACRNALEQYAEACTTPGDERTKDQRMVDCLVDLILRPGETGLAPVQAQLTLIAGVDTLRGGDEPGEVDGQPLPAALIRELAYSLGLLPRPPAPTPAPNTPETGTPEPAPAQDEPADPTDAEATDAPATSARPTDATATEATATGATATQAADPEATATQPTDPEPTDPEPTDPEPTDAEPTDAEPTDAEPTDAEPTTGSPTEEARPAQITAGGNLPGLSAEEAAAAWLAELLSVTTVAGTALAHLPAIAVVEEISGQLLALTTAAGIAAAATCTRRACRTGTSPCTHPPDGPALGPPPDTDGYRPTAGLQRFARARDRRCRFPGCRAPAIRCDLDHNQPWPAGATSADNLCCLCRHHHRLSHQAPGWTMRRLPDGGLEWTLPGGDRITTHPPRYGTDDPPPPTPAKSAPPPRLTLKERVLGRPATPDERLNDPPPF